MAAPKQFGAVDATRINHADQDHTQWFTTGPDGDSICYPPLTLINDHNVNKLGFAWEYRTSTGRGLEATISGQPPRAAWGCTAMPPPLGNMRTGRVAQR